MGKRKKIAMIPVPQQIGQALTAEAPHHMVGDPITPRPRPGILHGRTVRLGTGCGNLYVTINFAEMTGKDACPTKLNGATGGGTGFQPVNATGKDACATKRPFEIFCHLGKPGGCTMAQLEALARIISLCLRLGGSTKDICKQLRGIKCPQGITSDAIRVESCADAIVKALEIVGGERCQAP